MEYRIGKPDELYHYGVKGMKWGVRKQPQSTGYQRSSVDDHYVKRERRIRNAKKVAVGVAVVAAVAGVSYVAIKMHKAKQVKTGMNALRQSRVVINERRLTGHSQRLTKYGANGYQERFYLNRYNRAARAGRYNDVGRYGKARQEAQKRLTQDWYAGKKQVFTKKPIKKLQRKSFAPQTFTPKYSSYTYTDNNGQSMRVYGNRSYKERRR